jgi:hypothetical protein
LEARGIGEQGSGAPGEGDLPAEIVPCHRNEGGKSMPKKKLKPSQLAAVIVWAGYGIAFLAVLLLVLMLTGVIR